MPRGKQITVLTPATNPKLGETTHPNRQVYLVNPEQVVDIHPLALEISPIQAWKRYDENGYAYGPRVEVCRLDLGDGSSHYIVEGSADAINKFLWPLQYEDAAETGVTFAPTTGWYTLEGDGPAARVVGHGETVTLDPARMTEDATEWRIVRPSTQSSSYRFQIRVAATASFTPQRWQRADEPTGQDGWVDVPKGGNIELQTTTRLRVKPESS